MDFLPFLYMLLRDADCVVTPSLGPLIDSHLSQNISVIAYSRLLPFSFVSYHLFLVRYILR